MAFYAEMRRRNWYCVNQRNLIIWYSNLLYDEWYNNLTEEQKQRLKEAKINRDIKREAELNNAIMRLITLTNFFTGQLGSNCYDRYMR